MLHVTLIVQKERVGEMSEELLDEVSTFTTARMETDKSAKIIVCEEVTYHILPPESEEMCRPFDSDITYMADPLYFTFIGKSGYIPMEESVRQHLTSVVRMQEAPRYIERGDFLYLVRFTQPLDIEETEALRAVGMYKVYIVDTVISRIRSKHLFLFESRPRHCYVTLDEAKAFLHETLQQQVARSRKQLESDEAALKRFESDPTDSLPPC